MYRIRFHGHAEASASITEAVMKRLRFSRADTATAVALVSASKA